MSPILWVFFAPHIALFGTLIAMILNEQCCADEEERKVQSKKLAKFERALKKASGIRYQRHLIQEASPMRMFTISSCKEIKNAKLKRVAFLAGDSRIFNTISPLYAFTADNKDRLVTISTMWRYHFLSRTPRKIRNISTIADELAEELYMRHTRRCAYNRCLRRLPLKATAFSSPFARIIRRTHPWSPLRRFVLSNKRALVAAAQIVAAKRNVIDTLGHHATVFNDKRKEALNMRQNYSAVLRELLMKKMDELEREEFEMKYVVPNVFIDAKSKTILRLDFPDDKVYCHRTVADLNIEGFEAHIEYLSSNRIHNYCTLPLTGSREEIIAFTRAFMKNYSYHKLSVWSDTVKGPKTVTCDFTHKDLISTKAFEKYQKAAAEYGAIVSYPTKFNGSNIRVTFNDTCDMSRILKHFKGLIHKSTTTMTRWINVE